MVAERCSKCNREMESHLDGSDSTLCYLCIGEGLNLLGLIESLDRSGLKEVDRNTKCAVCSRQMITGDEAVSSDHGYVCKPCIFFFQNNLEMPINVHLAEAKTWLLKTSLKITGPYSENRIRMGIENREISSLDELCNSRGFWKYVRDLEEFSGTLKDVQTETNRHEQVTRDITQSVRSVSFATDPGYENRTKPADIVDVSPRKLQSMTENSATGIFIKTRLLPGFIVLAVLFGGAYVYKNRPQSFETTVQESFDEESSRQQLEKLYKSGKYFAFQETATRLEVNGFKLSTKELIWLVQSYLATDDVFSAELNYKKLNDVKFDLDKTLLGSRIEFLKGAPAKSHQILMQKSQVYSDNNMFNINLAYLESLSGDVNKAIRLVPDRVGLEDLNSNRGLSELFAYLKSNKQMSFTRLREFKSEVGQMLDAAPSLYVLLGLLYKKAGKELDAMELIAKALNQNPDYTPKFIQNEELIPYADRWNFLDSVVRDLELGDGAMTLALQALTAYKTKDKSRGKRLMVEAARLNPKNELLKDWKRFFESQKIEFSTPLDPLFLESSSPFRLSMVADQCLQNNNLKCAQQVLVHLHSLDPQDIYSLERLIKVNEKLGLREDSKQLFQRAIAIAPRYIPFIEMEERFL
ncbi:MAG: hypothetical protein VX642_15055 [Bdellovibrionota bacterium]|nr:hypothetical protein [Bdellovibrionota bacterium]